MEGTIERRTENGTAKTTVELDVTAVNETTVAEPAWVDERVTAVNATTVAGGRLVKLTHTGGPALSGANLTVLGGGVLDTVEDVDLEPGETVYLVANETAISRTVTLSRERPTVGEGAADFTEGAQLLLLVEDDDYSATVTAYRNESVG